MTLTFYFKFHSGLTDRWLSDNNATSFPTDQLSLNSDPLSWSTWGQVLQYLNVKKVKPKARQILQKVTHLTLIKNLKYSLWGVLK